MKHPLRITAAFIIAINVAACAASRSSLSQEDIAEYHVHQGKWLMSLKAGMTPGEVLEQVPPYKHYVFRFNNGEILYQYIQGKYPGTQTLYGLFFEDGRLSSVLLNQPVTDFDLCRSGHLRKKDGWPLSGFQETVAWINFYNRLGDDNLNLDPVNLTGETKSKSTSAGDIVESVAYVPLAVIVAPVYGIYELGTDSEKEKENRQEAQIKLGHTTEAQLLETHGEPLNRWKRDKDEILNYRVPDASFGVADGVVWWSEYNWWGTPSNGYTSPSGKACVLRK